MKVLHIITTIERGGAENQLITLICEQIRMGNNVSVLFLKGLPELMPELESIGCNSLDSLANRSFVKQLLMARRIERNGFDIVHAHLPRSEIFAAANFPKSKLVASKHNAEAFFPNGPTLFSKFLARLVLLKFSRIICISSAVQKTLEELGELPRNSGKVSVVYYGFSSTHTMEPRTRHVPTMNQMSEITLGTVSRLAPQKDLPTMIEAIVLIRNFGYECNLHIFGEGPLRESLLKEISLLHLDKFVTLEGRTSEPQKVISSFDVFLLTSNYEGFGLVLLEAMQCETPIIAAKNSAIIEVLGNDYPWFFETGDSQNLAEVLKQMIETLDLQKIKSIYRERLINFSPVKMAHEVDQVYESLLS